MTVCTRFEDEGLLALERGESLSAHFSECGDCLEAQRAYLSLKGHLTALGDNTQPVDGWQDQVLESIVQAESIAPTTVGTSSRMAALKSPMLALAASIAVAAVAIPLFFQHQGVPENSDQLVAMVVKGETNYRGYDAKLGDSLNLRFGESKAAHSELRIYLDNRIYFQCDLACIGQSGGLGGSAILNSVGEYQSILIQSSQPIAVPAERLDEDVLYARDNGLKVVLSEKVLVQ